MALAFGLSIVVPAYSVTASSDGHVNPARSLSAALFALIGNDTEAIKEIWIYICAPLLGALLAALLWKALFVKKSANETK